MYTLGVNLTKKMKNTRTRVKTKVYEMQLKLDRNQNIVGYSKDEDLRFHIERIQFAYIYLNIMCFFLLEFYSCLFDKLVTESSPVCICICIGTYIIWAISVFLNFFSVATIKIDIKYDKSFRDPPYSALE